MIIKIVGVALASAFIATGTALPAQASTEQGKATVSITSGSQAKGYMKVTIKNSEKSEKISTDLPENQETQTLIFDKEFNFNEVTVQYFNGDSWWLKRIEVSGGPTFSCSYKEDQKLKRGDTISCKQG